MIEHIQALLLAILEMVFIFVGLALLYSQRRSIGKAPFFISIGLVTLLSTLVSAADCRVVLAGTMDFSVGSVVLLFPVISIILMVYITEGTLETQHLIIGLVVFFGLFLYLGELTRLECNWLGFSINSGISANTLDELLAGSRSATNVLGLSYLLEMFLIPMIYTRLRLFKIHRIFSILGAFLLAVTITYLLFGVIINSSFAALFDTGTFVARLCAAVLIAILLQIYLSMVERDIKSGEKSPLDLVFAFFGSYGRSKELEKNLREWEDSYKVILENAGEVILMTTASGKIINANLEAVRVLGGAEPDDLLDKLVFPRLKIIDHPDLDLNQLSEEPVRFRAVLDESSSDSVILSCSVSPIKLRGQSILLLIASDITEEIRSNQEKEQLREQLAHSQRLESLGMLAGGIAHDFNNFIHSILGHVDLITLMYKPERKEAVSHLEKITSIAEKAGHLTSQLLGFARKGKYQLVDINIQKLLEDSIELLGPQNLKHAAISFKHENNLPPVKADQLQIQQVLLNLMLNALYAMKDVEDGKLSLMTGRALNAPIKPERPAELGNCDLSRYCFIMIKDNGIGMSDEVKRKVFEPFFTTKPIGQGTGMGLAMAYGTISNHHGWIQLKSELNIGTAFYIFLPFSDNRSAGGPADN